MMTQITLEQERLFNEALVLEYATKRRREEVVNGIHREFPEVRVLAGINRMRVQNPARVAAYVLVVHNCSNYERDYIESRWGDLVDVE